MSKSFVKESGLLRIVRADESFKEGVEDLGTLTLEGKCFNCGMVNLRGQHYCHKC